MTSEKLRNAPLEQAARLVLALLLVVEPHHDADQAPAAVHRRDDDAVARLLGMPRLQAIDAELGPEQRVAVVELVLAVGELLLGEDRV